MEINEDLEIVDHDKRAIQNEIFEKMQQMKDMFIDLNEDEVDRIQDILEYESDNDNSNYDEYPEGGFEWLDSSEETIFPIPFTSKLEIDHDEQTYDNDENLDQVSADELTTSTVAEVTAQPSYENNNENIDQKTADEMENSTLNMQEATVQQSYENEDGSLDQSTADEMEAGTLNMAKPKGQQSYLNNDEHEQISADEMENTTSTVGEVTAQQSYENNDENIDQSTADEMENGTLNVGKATSQKSYVNNDESHEQVSADEIENSTSTVIEVMAQQSYENNDESIDHNTVEEITTHVGVVVKIEEDKATDQNGSETLTYFSPPSTSSSSVSKIPNHFARLDPNLHDLLSKQAKEKTQSKAKAGHSQVTIDELLEAAKLIFPGQCTYVS